MNVTLRLSDLVASAQSANPRLALTPEQRSQFRSACEAFVTALDKALLSGANVTLDGFASFRFTRCEARKGYIPKTGQHIVVPPKLRLRFNPVLNYDRVITTP